MAKLLLVEDDHDLCESLITWLTSQNHEVEAVHDGEEGSVRLRFYKYDVAILDWNLPKRTGIEVCKEYRSHGGTTAIIMLTGNDALAEKEAGLDAGADDYLTKPFHVEELSARVRALLRRPRTFTGNVLQAKDISLDPSAHRVMNEHGEIQLLPKEFALLEFFMRHPDETFSPEALLDRVWSSESDSSVDTVYTTIKTLRKKISPGSGSDLIKTVHGVGYRLQA